MSTETHVIQRGTLRYVGDRNEIRSSQDVGDHRVDQIHDAMWRIVESEVCKAVVVYGTSIVRSMISPQCRRFGGSVPRGEPSTGLCCGHVRYFPRCTTNLVTGT